MIETITNNLSTIIPIVISLFALCFSIKAYRHNVFNSRIQSYYQKASYRVFLVTLGFIDRFFGKVSFRVKIHNSIFSDSYLFPYKVCITPNIGGIARAQTFDLILTGIPLGIDKTFPIVRNKLKKFYSLSRDYAHHDVLSFIDSEKYPYFNFTHEKLRSFGRYHFCIEITDFSNNTEIWYMAFSLVVNRNDKRNVISYEFDDINIVSPKDMIKNLDRVLSFNKSLEDIEKEKDFDTARYDLQLFEMKKYFLFLKRLKVHL